MAESLKRSGNYVDASKVYEKLIDSDKDNIDHYLELAKLYRKLGQNPQAVIVLKQAQSIKPNDTRITQQLGFALLGAGQPDIAKDVFENWLKTQPENPSAYNGKAIALDYLGDHMGAQAAYRKALGFSPANMLDIQNNLAMSMILAGQWSEAINLLEPLVQNGGNKTMRQNLALAYGLKGDKKNALALNERDLSPEKAKENMRFYENYLKRLKKGGRVPPPVRMPTEAPVDTAQQAAPVQALESAPIKDNFARPASSDVTASPYPSQKKR
jgi:Flp pilus assembly protein TadD